MSWRAGRLVPITGRAMRILAFLLLTGVLVSAAAPLRAQSLAEVAKKEEERRKDAKASPKAYSNKDLKEVPPPVSSADVSRPADPPPDAQTPAAPDGKQPQPDQTPAGADDKTRNVTKDRLYWRTRLQDRRDQLDRDRTLADALQTRVNSLTADFSSRDDPAQRAKIGVDRQKALAELDRMKRSADADQKAIAALEEEARRAGVPPGWLR
jgi:hypothetical protein